MPPKKAAAAAEPAVTVDAIYEAGERLASSENEADFKLLLSALKAGPKEKIAGIQFLARYAGKFPKQAKATMTSVKAAATDADEQVRLAVFRELQKFAPIDADEVSEIMFTGLGDSEERIVELVRGQLKRAYDEGGEEFHNLFFEKIQSQKDQAQAQMVDFVRENIKFDEENAQKLLPVLQAAFKTSVKEGLLLFRKTRRLLKEEDWKPLVMELVTRFDNSLEKQFAPVMEHLLIPLLDNTKCMGEEARGKLIDSIGTKVLPRWDELQTAQKVGILQKVAELARDCHDEEVLVNLYKNAFLTLNTEQVNFSIIEAVLFALTRLARIFAKTASQLVGTVLVYTGQPSESEGVTESEEAQAEFKAKVEAIKAVCDPFIECCEAQIQEAKRATGEDRKKMMDTALKQRRCGGNTRKLCTLWLSSAPLQGKPPSTPSWIFMKNKSKKFAKGSGKPGKKQDRKGGDKKPGNKQDRKGGDNKRFNKKPFRK